MNSNRSYFSNVKRILLVVLFFNFAVALVKIIYGYWTNSLSLTSDGFHSLFDGTSNDIKLFDVVAPRNNRQFFFIWIERIERRNPRTNMLFMDNA